MSETKDLLVRLSKQRGAEAVGEPCARWLDAVDARDEIVRLREVIADLLEAIDDGERISHPTDPRMEKRAIYLHSLAVGAARAVITHPR